MKSGVYCFEFKDGSKYVGKTIDFERRWKEHTEKMIAGKAAGPIQTAYNQYGLPVCYVLIYCHSDHIDLMETYFIGKINPSLNSVGGIYVEGSDLEVLEKYANLLEYSTAEHIIDIVAANNKLQDAKIEHKAVLETWRAKYKEIEKFLDTKSPAWSKLKELEQENYEMYALCAEQESRLKAPWWKRIFNKW